MSKEPLDEIQWKSPEWIQHFGLFTGNVLDYFSESPFYDRTSNNQVLRMQFQFNQIPLNVHPQQYLQQRLVEMTGTEFVIAFTREPDFWVIRKQRRLNPKDVITEQDYYIIGANVYQAPRVHDILSSRLLASVLSIKNCTGNLSKMSRYEILQGGHVYPKLEDSPSLSNSVVNTAANTATNAPSDTMTPSLSTGIATGASNINAQGASGSSGKQEILDHEFDSLLNSALNTNLEDIYMENTPLYDKITDS